jgi:hypothetical protein
MDRLRKVCSLFTLLFSMFGFYILWISTGCTQICGRFSAPTSNVPSFHILLMHPPLVVASVKLHTASTMSQFTSDTVPSSAADLQLRHIHYFTFDASRRLVVLLTFAGRVRRHVTIACLASEPLNFGVPLSKYSLSATTTPPFSPLPQPVMTKFYSLPKCFLPDFLACLRFAVTYR